MGDISQKYQKDFSRAQFKDPRRVRMENVRKNKIKKAIRIVAIISVLGFFYFVLFSSFFQIKNINITGINKISGEKFQNILNDYRYSRKFFLFSRNNILIFSKKDFVRRIGESYLLDSLEIDKNLPQTLNIIVNERRANIILINENQCVHLDDLGQIIENCDGGVIEQIVKIKHLGDVQFNIGAQAFEAQTLNYLIETKKYLEQQIPVDLIYYNYESKDSIKIETGQNFDVYMNLELPYPDQIDRLFILLESEEVKEQINNIKYFDLRFGEKLYYQ